MSNIIIDIDDKVFSLYCKLDVGYTSRGGSTKARSAQCTRVQTSHKGGALMKKASLVLLALALFMCAAFHWADNAMAEKQPYRHFLALGATQPVSNAEENRMSPLIMYNWFMEDFPNDLYAQFGLTTTRVFFIFGIKNDSLFAGIKPQYNHSIYSGFHAYNTRGELDQTRVFKGNNMGAELFARYNLDSTIKCNTFL